MVRAVPRPGFRRLQRPERGGPHRRGLGGAAFSRPVPECVHPPPPFPPLPWTLLRRLPSVCLSVLGPPFRLGVCQPPAGFLPLGLG